MRRSLAVVLGLVLGGLPRVGAGEPEAPSTTKEARVRELLELTGAGKLGDQAMETMLGALQRQPGLPRGFVEKFKELAKPEELIDRIVPIYEKQLDDATLDAALAFYRTPAGRALAKAQPLIMQESMSVGQRWGREIAARALKELQAEHEAARDYSRQRAQDMDNMRALTALLLLYSLDGPPFKEGLVDVYALVRKGDIPKDRYRLLRSVRFDSGPTDEEIEKEDYTNFPYERFRGEWKRGGDDVPLLWDRKPDEKGGRLVGMSSGKVLYYFEVDIDTMLEKHGQKRS